MLGARGGCCPDGRVAFFVSCGPPWGTGPRRLIVDHWPWDVFLTGRQGRAAAGRTGAPSDGRRVAARRARRGAAVVPVRGRIEGRGVGRCPNEHRRAISERSPSVGGRRSGRDRGRGGGGCAGNRKRPFSVWEFLSGVSLCVLQPPHDWPEKLGSGEEQHGATLVVIRGWCDARSAPAIHGVAPTARHCRACRSAAASAAGSHVGHAAAVRRPVSGRPCGRLLAVRRRAKEKQVARAAGRARAITQLAQPPLARPIREGSLPPSPSNLCPSTNARQSRLEHGPADSVDSNRRAPPAAASAPVNCMQASRRRRCH